MPTCSILRSSILGAAIALGLVAASVPVRAESPAPLPEYVIAAFGSPPQVSDVPLTDSVQAAIQTAFVDSITSSSWGPDQQAALEVVTASGDPRLAWIISDLMRFVTGGTLANTLGTAAASLLQIDPPTSNHWGIITDQLIAWDIPAPPDYLSVKRAIFTGVVPQWSALFVEGDIDWRHVSWGGVLIDDRAFGQTHAPCNCIPAADNPTVSSAKDATWLEDSDIVFGIEVNGEYRAYPRQIMEVREMVNDTLGGRDLGIPYCTLCGAAQAYFTDRMPDGVERPVLRTSGLLIRSNKVMYDVVTSSVFDTFLGKAVTGPLAERGLRLEQATVVTTDWASWKAEHPETTVLIEALALGRDFDFRNGRDADGPIFPIGDVDPRLPVHEDVIGAITTSGKPIAFQRSAALIALRNGETITFENIRLQLDAGGIRAVGADGADIGSHQAFWFAWSQFHPDTELWSG
ncbi:DUF3179 domain-containing protein [Marivita cryptomonadis]|uniref:DUF3179 domain-containing protein n=2 Tax=Roseobacteraceae TaxID=2854170 RepID=A0A9Q2NUG8_9RHOB|nr:DUF3179 domain-containing protein [Marivita cryptomonadis]MBM2330889.1 DUF3179 domain-containing protein [Marivita cryptomonadis]MBM2340475.1 DUF3179 domain-containing protein [Marivita cryptomonadis]MBM2345137.1 DUF3179 domain-containing protein [Marivita cryptomonadis]MBM2349815.1 DUF3179 domain-containing protein [Marivita cryptomonadis]